jgi:hypothetical protein
VRYNRQHPPFPDLQLSDAVRTSFAGDTEQPGLNAMAYRAPEQWNGYVVPATDQYALAVMAYYLLTQHVPFTGTAEQLRDQHLHMLPRPPGTISAHISPAIDTVLLRALAKKPEERYPSIIAFAQAFQQVASVPSPPQAAREMLPSFAPLPDNRHSSSSSRLKGPLVLGLIVLVVVSSIGVGFYALINYNRQIAFQVTPTPTGKTPGPTSTAATAAPTINGTVVLQDDLTNNSAQLWLESPACQFTQGAYHVIVEKENSRELCDLKYVLDFADMAIQVDITIIEGNTAGLIFRSTTDGLYLFEFSNKGDFSFCKGSANVKLACPIKHKTTSAITTTTGKNTLLITARGDSFKFYINNTLVGETQDASYPKGVFGFIAGTAAPAKRTEAGFSNLTVSEL